MSVECYKSKVDLWILLLTDVIIIVPSVFVLVKYPLSLVHWGVVLVGAALPLLVVHYLMNNISYEINDEFLVVRAKPLLIEHVRLSRITKVEKTSCILSAPAASLDRIKITYGRSAVVISPKDKEAFVEDLRRACPQPIEVHL